MPVRTAMLGRAAAPDALAHNLYQVPAGDTVIVKNIRIYNPNGAPTNVSVGVTNAGATVYTFLENQSVPANSELDSGIIWVVMAPTDILNYQCSAAGPLIWASGSILPGVAQ